MNNYILLLFNPIHALNTRYLAKVLGVVRDNGQAIMAGSDSNENVKIAYSQALFGGQGLLQMQKSVQQVFLQYAYLHHHDVGKIQSKYRSQE